MSAKRFITNVLVLTVMLLIAGGCAKCYKVTDTSTNAVYYTHHVDRECDGTVEFRNAKTQSAWSFGEKVCLQSAQIERMQRCYCRSEDITDPPCPRPCSEEGAAVEKVPCTPCVK
jgi:hypothetical protein